ncbi:hypothetical protein [Streptomyces sp. PSKA30]|nr:hypothetical protein [Streptomyces sp. PSKA30]MBZ9638314.1 hypothetical protein [Streptomyces sp. PSKA30]
MPAVPLGQTVADLMVTAVGTVPLLLLAWRAVLLAVCVPLAVRRYAHGEG